MNEVASIKKKFKSLDEAQEFLLSCKDKDMDISQNQFMESINDLGLNDDELDALYSWCDDHEIAFMDEGI